MAFIKVEDIHGQIEVICFPKVYERAVDYLENDAIVRIGGKIQFKDGEAQILAESIDKLEITEQQNKEPKEQKYLGVIISDGKQETLDNVLDVLTSYVGDIPVIVAINGKKYSAKCAVRQCEGLLSELKNYISEKDIIFFTKK